MKSLVLSVALSLALATGAQAACIGSGALQSCYDANGNSYTVNRMGNTTITNGFNSQTGSSWSQTSTTFGNTTFHNGRAANGNSWNMTQQQHGGGLQTFSGTNSQGGYFHHSCTTYGCL